jgi:hypothetical protein
VSGGTQDAIVIDVGFSDEHIASQRVVIDAARARIPQEHEARPPGRIRHKDAMLAIAMVKRCETQSAIHVRQQTF